MNHGRVYVWVPEPGHPLGGRVVPQIVPLARRDPPLADGARLRGRFVQVHNSGEINVRSGGVIGPIRFGDAAPDADGDFVFEPARGGPRVDKVPFVRRLRRERCIGASRFGEVNTYFHLDRIGAHIDGLLRELGAPSLPPVVARVNAHHGATERHGIRDGVRKSTRWLPMQGGHYRLPARRHEITEPSPIAAQGEIHLGPGWRLLTHGALVELTGRPYRANASHNAGILYHEYGHHVTRHTADFRANALRPPDRQNNTKTALDEAFCDYWAATMLGTAHIWAFHHRHDASVSHPRSLVSNRTMAHFDPTRGADPHSNGTIFAAGLWDVRTALCAAGATGARDADRLVLKALLLMGALTDRADGPTVEGVRAARAGFGRGLAAVLRADEVLYGGAHRTLIASAFGRRGVSADDLRSWNGSWGSRGSSGHGVGASAPQDPSINAFEALLVHVPAADIPADGDLASAEVLESVLDAELASPPSLIAVGDVMLGGRARGVTDANGADHPFDAVRPLLGRAPIVLANLEGPFARRARRQDRNFSYRVNPALAPSLRRAGINVVTLANNHLLDCGREGVVETIDTLRAAGVTPIGAGLDERAARAPAVLMAGDLRVGLLGYYWNSRTAATAALPGSATDPPESMEADISALRRRADRVAVTFHWGIPYEREPLPSDREKARLAVDLGADAVIGHHPHVIQPLEVYRDRPIFYSVGNFAFGSGNSRAESLAVALWFHAGRTEVRVFPVYVKNRDPRVNYQPKILLGAARTRVLERLAAASGENGELLGGRGVIVLPHASVPAGAGGVAHV